MRFARSAKALGIFAAMLLVVACDGRRETREVLFTPDMHFSPAVKASEEIRLSDGSIPRWAPTGSSMREPVEGTVPVDFQPYTITDAEADTLAQALQNPLPITEEVLHAGEKYYNIYCTPCHGSTGDGNGTVPLRRSGMPQPPSLWTDKVTNEWSDGRIFHVITNGQGTMPSYAGKMNAETRWAVIHYVRALQQAYRDPEAASDSASVGESGGVDTAMTRETE